MSLSIFFYNKKLILITKKIFYNKKIIILFCFDGLLILMWLSHIFAQWYVFVALALVICIKIDFLAAAFVTLVISHLLIITPHRTIMSLVSCYVQWNPFSSSMTICLLSNVIGCPHCLHDKLLLISLF
jgi:hypothetical protein